MRKNQQNQAQREPWPAGLKYIYTVYMCRRETVVVDVDQVCAKGPGSSSKTSERIMQRNTPSTALCSEESSNSSRRKATAFNQQTISCRRTVPLSSWIQRDTPVTSGCWCNPLCLWQTQYSRLWEREPKNSWSSNPHLIQNLEQLKNSSRYVSRVDVSLSLRTSMTGWEKVWIFYFLYPHLSNLSLD